MVGGDEGSSGQAVDPVRLARTFTGEGGKNTDPDVCLVEVGPPLGKEEEDEEEEEEGGFSGEKGERVILSVLACSAKSSGWDFRNMAKFWRVMKWADAEVGLVCDTGVDDMTLGERGKGARGGGC